MGKEKLTLSSGNYEQQSGALVPYDPIYSKSTNTAAQYIPSQYKMGECHEYGSLTFPLDPRNITAWYTKAAEKGYSEAELAYQQRSPDAK